MKKLVTLLLSTMFLFSLDTFAFAADGSTVDPEESVGENVYDDNEKKALLEQRFKVISDYFDTLDSTRAKAFGLQKKISKLEQKLSSMKKEGTKEGVTIKKLAKEKDIAKKEHQKLLSKIKDLELNSEKLAGLKKLTEVTDSDDISVMYSDQGDVYVDPDLYYDEDSDHYVMHGQYRWKNDAWDADEVGDGPVGGYDGFQLFVDEDIDRYEYEFRLWTTEGDRADIDPMHDGDPEGDAWLWQDHVFYGWVGDPYYGENVEQYDSGYGSGYIYFEFEDPLYAGERVEVGAGYAHTWGVTSITGINVGIGGGGVSWTTDEKYWYDEDIDIEEF